MSVMPATVAEVGPMISGADVELAVKDTLRDWLPSYIAEYERQHGLQAGATPVPRGWVFTGRDAAKRSEDQFPCIIIMSGGISEKPRKEGGRGTLTAIWRVWVTAAFGASTEASSRRHAQAYANALHTLLLQRPVAIGDGATVDWLEESYDEIDFESSRGYSASYVGFNLEVRGVGWADGGPPVYVTPPTDPTDPFDPWPTVTSTDTTVDKQPIT